MNGYQYSIENKNEKTPGLNRLSSAAPAPNPLEFGLLQILLPATPGLVLYKIYDGSNRLFLSAASVQQQAQCPACLTLSTAVHSYYTRRVEDLPWSDKVSIFSLQVRRFYCYNPKCSKVTFAERLLPQIKAYARRTVRLDGKLRQLGLALGGNGGVKVAKKLLGVKLCADTLLNLIRHSAPAELGSSTALAGMGEVAEAAAKTEPLRIIGVDDFAFRRGARYGTLIVDIERHKVVDLLPDSTSATFEQWLHHHPQIEVISRDRASAYAEAARRATPHALQVADRFHLSKNLHEVTERIVKRYYTAISRLLVLPPQVEPNNQNASVPMAVEDQAVASPVIPPKPTEAGEVSFVRVDPAILSWKERRRQENIERKLQLYEQVKQLHERGFSRKEIAQKLNLDYGTVGRYLKGAPVVGARVLRRSKLNPYKPYIMQRYLQEHCDNAQQLWREITAQGYEGGVSGVSTFVAQLRFEQNGLELGGKALTKKLRPLSLSLPPRVKAKAGEVVPTVRQLSWYLFLPVERLKEPALSQLKTILGAEESLIQAYSLIQGFNQMMRERKANKLSEWLAQVDASGSEELKSFGGGIKRDEAAVRAGLTERWSQGVVEGKVNKVKLIKRQLYGRANFDLLRTMVLSTEVA